MDTATAVAMSRINRATEYRLLSEAFQRVLIEHSEAHQGIDIGIAAICLLDGLVVLWLDNNGDLDHLLDAVRKAYAMSVN